MVGKGLRSHHKRAGPPRSLAGWVVLRASALCGPMDPGMTAAAHAHGALGPARGPARGQKPWKERAESRGLRVLGKYHCIGRTPRFQSLLPLPFLIGDRGKTTFSTKSLTSSCLFRPGVESGLWRAGDDMSVGSSFQAPHDAGQETSHQTSAELPATLLVEVLVFPQKQRQ